MNISPLDIYNREFNKSAFGGYKTSEVEEFLDEVGVAYEKSLKEINSLKDEKEKLQEKLKNYENIEEKLEETLLSVQEAAREQSRQAKKEADTIIKQANMKADKIIDEAKMKIQEEEQRLEHLKDTRQLFEIRFKSLLESHLQLLEEGVASEEEREIESSADHETEQSLEQNNE